MKPYYEQDGVTIYHGDCREILSQLDEAADVIITDPVWPNALPQFYGADRPQEMFAEAAALFSAITNRLIVQLGCDSDPRFLLSVPREFPFLRVCWLDYVRSSYKGRLLYTGDVAYVFGQPPQPQKGRFLMPGKCTSSRSDRLFRRGTGGRTRKSSFSYDHMPHGAPRRLEHVRWLVQHFSDGLVLDPFAGAGTTLVAAKYHGQRAIGIEIEEQYCELAVSRLGQMVMKLK